MSKFSSNAVASLIGLSLLITASPVFAQDNRILPVLNPAPRQTATTGAITAKKPLLVAQQGITATNPVLQKITIKDIEDRIAGEREKIASKAALLKTRLQAFKDQVKASLAERINTNLNMINQNQTRQMQGYLDTMTNILDKLETRVKQPTPDIKDPAAAQAAITSARAVIATASASVAAQAQKDYTIQVTSESRIKLDAQLQRDKLKTDLLAIRKAVIDAKQAVTSAIRIAKSGSTFSDIELKKEGTSSGRQ